jgi:uncharacterized iron-regulated membrane protein
MSDMVANSIEESSDQGLNPQGQSPDASTRRSGSLYRVIWRWHFYAGLLVAPPLVILSVTGGLYIFKSEILDYARRDMVFVNPASSHVPCQHQLDAALAAHPGRKAIRFRLSPIAYHSTLITLIGESKGKTIDVYVNPANGGVLGSVASDSPLNVFFNTVLKLHRTLYAGMTGRVFNELATSWTVVMVITGLYLWWPRGKRKGVWTYRRGAKRYTTLRDLHSVTGCYLLIPCAIIAVTGMFYTPWFGWEIREGARRWIGHEEAVAKAESAAAPCLSLDELMGVARRRYPDRFLSATLASEPGDEDTLAIKAINDIYRTYGPMRITDLEVEQSTGAVRKSTDDTQTMFFWHTWTWPLHVGSILGLTTKILWLIACLVLVALPITGVWMWWERRPRGKTGFPRKPAIAIPLRLVSIILLLSLVLPVMGASVILVLMSEWIFRRFISIRSLRTRSVH